MRTSLMALLLASMLVGCGPQPEQATKPNVDIAASAPAPTPIPMDATAGPSGMDGLTWMFDQASENGSGNPRLMYSARASDEMGLNLQCDAEGVQALIVRNAPDVVPGTWRFLLVSGPQEAELAGEASGEPGSEMIVRARLPLDAPVLTRLRETGEIGLRDDGRLSSFNAINAAERAAIAQFFTACAQFGGPA